MKVLKALAKEAPEVVARMLKAEGGSNEEEPYDGRTNDG